jgi:hypothetical protein
MLPIVESGSEEGSPRRQKSPCYLRVSPPLQSGAQALNRVALGKPSGQAMHAAIRASLPEAKSLAHRCGLKNEAVREEESERANAKQGRAFQALPSASPRLPKGTVAKKAKGKAMAKSVGGWVMDASSGCPSRFPLQPIPQIALSEHEGEKEWGSAKETPDALRRPQPPC